MQTRLEHMQKLNNIDIVAKKVFKELFEKLTYMDKVLVNTGHVDFDIKCILELF